MQAFWFYKKYCLDVSRRKQTEFGHEICTSFNDVNLKSIVKQLIEQENNKNWKQYINGPEAQAIVNEHVTENSTVLGLKEKLGTFLLFLIL